MTETTARTSATSNDSPTDRATQGHVVLDLGSYAHRVGSLTGERYADIDLSRLVDLFVGYGVEVRRLVVAGPFVPVSLGRGSRRVDAKRMAARAEAWWEAQASRWSEGRHRDVELRRVLGATDGTREVGVDALVAAAALDLVSTLPDDAHELGNLVAVCSHDSDLHHLHRYAAPVPVLVAGCFSRDERWRLRQADAGGRQGSVVPHLRFRREDFGSIASAATTDPIVLGVGTAVLGERDSWPGGVHPGSREGDRVVVASDGSGRRVLSSPLNRAPHPRVAGAAGVRSVAVVDPYGIANAAISSIGVADLPRAHAVHGLLSSLGWDSPIAVHAVVPDLDPGRVRGLPQDLQQAWHERDAELDELALEMDDDGDPLTVARRAVLQPDRVDRSRLGSPLDRDVTALATKRLSTGLIAELWAARSSVDDGGLVLCSEDADVVWALGALPPSGIDRFRAVVRVGVHARRVKVLGRAGVSGRTLRRRLGDHDFVVLTDAQLAELVGVSTRSYGRRLRQRLHHAVRTGAEWRLEGFDPETGAAIVSTVVPTGEASDDAQERIESRYVATSSSTGRRRRAARPDAATTLRFDSARPCAMPVVAPDTGRSSTVEATVVSWKPGVVAVDVDGDLVPDFDTDPGHDITRYVPGTRITVLLDADGRCHLVDPGHHAHEAGEPELVVLGPVTERGRVVRAVEDDSEGLSLPPPGEAEVHGDEGDVVLAVRDGDSDTPTWTVLSSPLPHLSWLTDTSAR